MWNGVSNLNVCDQGLNIRKGQGTMSFKHSIEHGETRSYSDCLQGSGITQPSWVRNIGRTVVQTYEGMIDQVRVRHNSAQLVHRAMSNFCLIMQPGCARCLRSTEPPVALHDTTHQTHTPLPHPRSPYPTPVSPFEHMSTVQTERKAQDNQQEKYAKLTLHFAEELTALVERMSLQDA